jgi:hypothetical protein
MDSAAIRPEHEELGQREAVDAVARSARRLFPFVSEQQARDLAAAVLRDLASEDICLVRIRSVSSE